MVEETTCAQREKPEKSWQEEDRQTVLHGWGKAAKRVGDLTRFWKGSHVT